VTAYAWASNDGGVSRVVVAATESSAPITSSTVPASIENVPSSLSTSTEATPPEPPTSPAACEGCTPATVALPTLALPQPGDFSGKLLFYGQDCDACPYFNIGKNYGITLRNESAHVFDLSASAPLRLAAICGPDLTPDGLLAYPLTRGSIVGFVEYPPDMNSAGLEGGLLFPGEEASSSIIAYGGESYPASAPHTALFTCEGAIVASDDGSWRPPTVTVVARLRRVASRSVGVVPDYPGAPTSTRPAPTSTTVVRAPD